MTNLVVDSWAWIEYLDGSPIGSKVREYIINGQNNIFSHVLSISEIISKEKRCHKDPETAWNAITNLSKILYIDESDSKQAGLLHAEIKSKNKNFGLADSFLLYAARKIDGKVLTNDPDFKGIPDAIMLK